MELEKSYLINLKDLEDKADEILDELTKEIDGRPVVVTDHYMNETIRSRQPHEGVEISSWMNNTNKRLNILDAKVNKLSDIVSDLRVVVEESRINDNVGDGEQDMLAKKKMVDHSSIIDSSSLEFYFIKMRQSYKNQKNVLAAWKFLQESDRVKRLICVLGSCYLTDPQESIKKMYSDRNVEAEIKKEFLAKQQKLSDTNVWLNTEIKKLGNSINACQFKIITTGDIPFQTNTSSCGVFICKYFEFYARVEKIPFDQKEQILTSVDTLGIKTSKKLLILNLNGIMTEVIRVNDKSPIDVDKTVVAASSQDTSSPLDDRTCDSQEDSCKYASPTGVSVVPFSLDCDICTSLMDVHRTVVVASSQGVVSSSLDHGTCASLANANKTDVVASSQKTYSPLDDRT
ncbi:hypothetical protein KY285_010516 [Solanum tuberosum]|nr:hypothetical protein KY285_010516 [Solanum tuberosum]